MGHLKEGHDIVHMSNGKIINEGGTPTLVSMKEKEELNLLEEYDEGSHIMDGKYFYEVVDGELKLVGSTKIC